MGSRAGLVIGRALPTDPVELIGLVLEIDRVLTIGQELATDQVSRTGQARVTDRALVTDQMAAIGPALQAALASRPCHPRGLTSAPDRVSAGALPGATASAMSLPLAQGPLLARALPTASAIASRLRYRVWADDRARPSQLPANANIQDRRDALHDRLAGGGRPEQLPAGDRQQNRDDRRQDQQQVRNDRQDNRQDVRNDRQENRQDVRNDRPENREQRRDDRQQTRDDRQQNRGDQRQDRQDTRQDRQGNRQDIRNDRQDNRQNIRQDWQQQRDEIRNDWQQYRDDARGDWQNWFDDHYGRYAGWYVGYAPAYWRRWDHLWDSYPVAAGVGLTWWAANSLGHQFGYTDYYNPYYTESMPAYYAEPIITPPIEPIAESTHAAASPQGVSSEAMSEFDQARAAFLAGQYVEALKLTDNSIARMPNDAVLHEFPRWCSLPCSVTRRRQPPSIRSWMWAQAGTGRR